MTDPAPEREQTAWFISELAEVFYQRTDMNQSQAIGAAEGFMRRMQAHCLSIVPTPQPGMVTISVEVAEYCDHLMEDAALTARTPKMRQEIRNRQTPLQLAITAAIAGEGLDGTN